MRFGLLYEAQRPFEGTTVDWNALYKETIEQCVLADRVGFTIPHEQALRSIELFGTRVIPACRLQATRA